MDYVVDIQGFKDSSNQFIPKEVAVVGIDCNYFGHWIISPPCSFNDLPQKIRTQNNWLTRHFHGLEWFDGETQTRQLYAILRDIARTANTIFTRGREKALLLQTITSRQIINLEDNTDCPSFMNLPSSRVQCIHHGALRDSISKRKNCALNYAQRLRKWLKFTDEGIDAWSCQAEPSLIDTLLTDGNNSSEDNISTSKEV